MKGRMPSFDDMYPTYLRECSVSWKGHPVDSSASVAVTVFSRPTSGAWSGLGEVWTAAELARCGFDWVCLDAQHGRWNDQSMLTALALFGGQTPTLVRVRSNDDGLIGRALDCGAAGVIVPMVSTAAAATAAAGAAHYPPAGHRSWGPLTAGYGQAMSTTVTPFCAVMIETAEGVANVDAIAVTSGVSGLFVGPFDLALALGTSVDELIGDGEILRSISSAARRAGIVAGAFAGTPERAKDLRALGYDFLAVTTDSALLSAGAAAALSA